MGKVGEKVKATSSGARDRLHSAEKIDPLMTIRSTAICRGLAVARILDRLSQHRIKLALAEFWLPPLQWFRHLLSSRTGASRG